MLMKIFVDIYCDRFCYSIRSAKFFNTGITDFIYILEMLHECFTPYRSDTLYCIKHWWYLCLAPETPVIFYCKSVCFILNSRNKFKSFTVRINRYLDIIVIKSSRIVVVVFNHSTYRNFKSKLVKYLKCNIYIWICELFITSYSRKQSGRII